MKAVLDRGPVLTFGSGHGLHNHPEQEKFRRCSRCRRRSAVTTPVLSAECTVTHRSFANNEERIRWLGQPSERIPPSRPSDANGRGTCRWFLLRAAHRVYSPKHGLCSSGIRGRPPDAAGAYAPGKDWRGSSTKDFPLLNLQQGICSA